MCRLSDVPCSGFVRWVGHAPTCMIDRSCSDLYDRPCFGLYDRMNGRMELAYASTHNPILQNQFDKTEGATSKQAITDIARDFGDP